MWGVPGWGAPCGRLCSLALSPPLSRRGPADPGGRQLRSQLGRGPGPLKNVLKLPPRLRFITGLDLAGFAFTASLPAQFRKEHLQVG